MRKQSTLRVPRPRNPIVQALVRRIAGFAVGRHRDARQGARRSEAKDLDQRVREIGEW
jgi:hypothetical protein